jgi:probable HAF family extracellular repeat protein
MNRLQNVGVVVGALALAAGVLGVSAPVDAHRAGASYAFTSIASQSDPTFTQLLGINKSGVIAGYYGSGADAQHPNKGFTLVLPSTFTAENYPDSAQTQVIGINNHGDTDGFYVDSKGVTHGFTDIGGSFSTVDMPGTTFNQLLGLNNNGEEVGYYQFGPSNSATFVPYIREADGVLAVLPIANAQATSINDNGLVGGFSNDQAGNSHGYLWHPGSMKTVDVHGAVSTQVLGVNNMGEAVGSFVDSKKAMHGFTYSTHTKVFTQIDVPGSTSTVVNGINQRGWLVGFYTDAKNNTIGFVAKPTNM